MQKTRIWQWPNIVAADAAVIALAWQAVFAEHFECPLGPAAYSVLGLSVWLTYMADRLFDAAKRSPQQLHSARHSFAKIHFKSLWMVWAIVLTGNVLIALNGLDTCQLVNGGILLLLCLLYTFLNQLLSRRFFPKEICVALIFAGGVIVFLAPPYPWLATGALTLVCLINCLMISNKELRIDVAMRVRSINQLRARHLLSALFIGTAIPLALLPPRMTLTLGATFAALAALQLIRRRLPSETFRVLTDSALLIGPAVFLFKAL